MPPVSNSVNDFSLQIDCGSDFLDQVPSILVRPKAALVNLGPIRALVEARSVMLFDSKSGDHSRQSALIHEMQGKLQDKSTIAYELREQAKLLPKINELLASLEESITQDKIKDLLIIKKELSRHDMKMDGIRQAIANILANDYEMAALYFSEKMSGKSLDPSKHDEVEFLLEHYLSLIAELSARVSSVFSNINSSETVMHIVLDKQRNNLILFDLRATLASVAIASGAFITSLFGMNIISTLEENHDAFVTVSVLAFVTSVVIFVGSMG
ncbi:magnesium ion transporter, partial [Quaeritorhiza haematococci]